MSESEAVEAHQEISKNQQIGNLVQALADMDKKYDESGPLVDQIRKYSPIEVRDAIIAYPPKIDFEGKSYNPNFIEVVPPTDEEVKYASLPANEQLPAGIQSIEKRIKGYLSFSRIYDGFAEKYEDRRIWESQMYDLLKQIDAPEQALDPHKGLPLERSYGTTFARLYGDPKQSTGRMGIVKTSIETIPYYIESDDPKYSEILAVTKKLEGLPLKEDDFHAQEHTENGMSIEQLTDTISSIGIDMLKVLHSPSN